APRAFPVPDVPDSEGPHAVAQLSALPQALEGLRGARRQEGPLPRLQVRVPDSRRPEAGAPRAPPGRARASAAQPDPGTTPRPRSAPAEPDPGTPPGPRGRPGGRGRRGAIAGSGRGAGTRGRTR